MAYGGASLAASDSSLGTSSSLYSFSNTGSFTNTSRTNDSYTRYEAGNYANNSYNLSSVVYTVGNGGTWSNVDTGRFSVWTRVEMEQRREIGLHQDWRIAPRS